MDFLNLNVCLCPLSITWENKEENMARLETIMESIHPSTDLLILPETFSTGFPMDKSKKEIEAFAELNDGPTLKRLEELSIKYNVAIAGSLIAREGENLVNRAFFIEPSSDIYFADKAHLFRMGGEDKIFHPGDKRLHVRYRGWNIDMIVCYDVRFPVWCRNVSNRYDLLIAVANWPAAREEVWETLLKARALENEAYVCGVNCSGIDPMENNYTGKSFAFDFKGKNIAVSDGSPELLYATLKRDKLEKFREKFPVWKDADSFHLFS